MGAGTFLSSRRFWEIRDSYRAGLTPSLPFLPSPQSQLVPQAHLSFLCPQGGPPPTAPLPSDLLSYISSLRIHLHPQTPSKSPLSSDPSLSPNPHLLPQSHCAHLVLFRLRQTMPPSLRPSPPFSDPFSSLRPFTSLRTCLPTSGPPPLNSLNPHPSSDWKPPAPSSSALPNPRWTKQTCPPPQSCLGRAIAPPATGSRGVGGPCMSF